MSSATLFRPLSLPSPPNFTRVRGAATATRTTSSKGSASGRCGGGTGGGWVGRVGGGRFFFFLYYTFHSRHAFHSPLSSLDRGNRQLGSIP
jgi:hypothetical protein